ncbi:ABC transporter permease [Dactylosporangium sp. CA-092794]|uniref:ABC transporter permease n=1 Tax=Dactylosporangium sp. CA-092794 TaxID=3239929 RepID=UPI003D8B8110
MSAAERASAAEPAAPARGGLLRRLRPSRLAAAGFLLAVMLVALLAPILPLADPTAGNVSERLLGLGAPGHPLGTDRLGRDILSRMVWGARVSLPAGLVPVLVGSLLGTGLGVVAGLGPHWLRTLVMRFLDIFFAFPALLLAIVIAATFRAGLLIVLIAITVIVVPPVARVAETETIRVRHSEFVVVARASGATWPTVALRHVLRNVGPAVIVYSTSLVGLAIVYSAGLSFLGLGVAPPTADWGGMVNELRGLVFRAPALALLPAVPIFAVSIAFTVLGNGLRDALSVESEVR